MKPITYELSEQEHLNLYQAKHLLWLLCNLTERASSAYPDIQVNSESLGVVLNIAHDLLSLPDHK